MRLRRRGGDTNLGTSSPAARYYIGRPYLRIAKETVHLSIWFPVGPRLSLRLACDFYETLHEALLCLSRKVAPRYGLV